MSALDYKSRRIEELETEIEHLKQRLSHILEEKDDDRLSLMYPFFSKLTPCEKIIFKALDSRGLGKIVTYEHLSMLLDSHMNRTILSNTVKVLLVRLRTKMEETRGHSFFIQTIHSTGLKLLGGPK